MPAVNNDGVVKTLHLRRCTSRALEVYAYFLRGATNFYHYDVQRLAKNKNKVDGSVFR